MYSIYIYVYISVFYYVYIIVIHIIFYCYYNAFCVMYLLKILSYIVSSSYLINNNNISPFHLVYVLQ